MFHLLRQKMKEVTPATTKKMEQRSKASCMELVPLGKHKRLEREVDYAEDFFGGSVKYLKSEKAYPAGQTARGCLRSSGGEERKRWSSASRGEPKKARSDWPSGKAANVDHRRRISSALSLREGTATNGFDQRRSLLKIEEKTEKRIMGKHERACRQGGERRQKKWLQARERVTDIMYRYRVYCEILEVDKSKMNLKRVDLMSSTMVKEEFPYPSKPFLGTVPGIEVGERFKYRMELHLVGVHRPPQGGIDVMKDGHGNKIAISVVDSGGYDNYMSNLETLVYCGQGSSAKEQKLKATNRALMRSCEVKNPVRVIRSMKLDRSVTYFYDGLYTVEDMWVDRKFDGNMLKFKLVRIPGQPSSLGKRSPQAENEGMFQILGLGSKSAAS